MIFIKDQEYFLKFLTGHLSLLLHFGHRIGHAIVAYMRKHKGAINVIQNKESHNEIIITIKAKIKFPIPMNA